MKTYKNKCNIKKTELFEILDKQAFAIAKVNPLGEYLYFNKKESFLREFDKNKYSPLNIFNFYNNQDCITLKKIFAHCLKSENKEFFFEYENKSNFFKMRLIKDIDGNILISTNNISKEKKSERILEENKENIKRLNDAVNGANIGCWDFFPQEGKIIANKTWVSQKKYKDQDFREKNELFSNIIDGLDKWATLVHPEDLENTKKIIQKHLEGKTDIYQAEFRMKCGDNKYRWIRDLGKVFLRDKNGNPIRMNGVHIDITESKNL